MVVDNLNEILNESNTLSDLARFIFNKENYTNRTKCKQILMDNGINWEEWLNSKKRGPVFCLHCGKEIVGKDRFRKKFCSHVCAGISSKRKSEKIKNCLYCGKEIKSKKY